MPADMRAVLLVLSLCVGDALDEPLHAWDPTSWDPSAAGSVRKGLLERSGDVIPLIGLGTWEAAPGVVGEAVKTALANGYRHIDCASAYRNEREVGEALVAQYPADEPNTRGRHAGGVRRRDIWLTSKLWNDRRRPEDVREAVETSLGYLQTSYLDLYLVHWPVVWEKNTLMMPDAGASLRAMWETLESLVDEGKIRNIGVANYNQRELRELLSYARIKPALNQIEIHPRLPQWDLVRFCHEHKIATTAYSPLGRGALIDEPTIVHLAATHGVSPASVLLRWNLQRGSSVIPKSVTAARIVSNLLEPLSFDLSNAEMGQIAKLEDGTRYCLSPWATFDDLSDRFKTGQRVGTLAACGIFSLVSVDITDITKGGDISLGTIALKPAPWDKWLGRWHESLGRWFAALPIGIQEGLQGCAAAFGLTLGSRLDKAMRGAAFSKAAAAPPPAPSSATEPGCEWVKEFPDMINMPDFPQMPSDKSEFELLPLIPIPRLLPQQMLTRGAQPAPAIGDEQPPSALTTAERLDGGRGSAAGVRVGAATAGGAAGAMLGLGVVLAFRGRRRQRRAPVAPPKTAIFTY